MITAEEMYSKTRRNRYIPDVMIEFAKLHVEAALKAVAKDLDTHGARYEYGEYVELSDIQDEYPLTNIK